MLLVFLLHHHLADRGTRFQTYTIRGRLVLLRFCCRTDLHLCPSLPILYPVRYFFAEQAGWHLHRIVCLS